jgi:RHS repeat-associated protein
MASLSSGAGALAQNYTFDSFGEQTASSGTLTDPFQYTARQLEPETNLYYCRARYYDPGTGNFLSEDPIRFEGDLNFYGTEKSFIRIDLQRPTNPKPGSR